MTIQVLTVAGGAVATGAAAAGTFGAAARSVWSSLSAIAPSSPR